MKVKHLRIDFTGWMSWKRCPRRFYYNYVRELKPASTSAVLSFGQVLHSGLEIFHTNGNEPIDVDKLRHELDYLQDPSLPPGEASSTALAALNRIKEEGTKLLSSELPQDLPFARYSVQHALELMAAYMSYYGQPQADFKAIEHEGKKMVEQSLEMKLSDKITFNGSIDLLAEDTKSGLPTVIDHKTAGSLYGFSDKARLSAQTIGYAALARANGIPVEQVIFNALKSAWGKTDKTLMGNPKRGTKPQHDKCFTRVRSIVSDWRIDELKENILRDGERIIQDIEEGRFTQTAPDACMSFNSVCPYADVCLSPDCDKELLLENLFTKQPWKGVKVELEEEK